ncbi:MAG: 50S ribosomal protein L5 [Candidatus Eremiobacteraeota bacterium]|nr:50S ribosomal protein L5 [Candidatus Eremiobacteraeota bacterium]MCW5868293.1 50S ribosomal protein L5 [Candidatus Eremiobacteraeota bacterium]
MAKKPEAQKGGGRSKGPIDLGGATEKVPFKKIPLRLKEKYRSEVVGALKEKFNYKNVMQVPRLEKVVINIGVGEAIGNPKLLDMAHAELGHITGQRPVITKARNSISNFKLREGVKIGTKVTLRGPRMWAFLDKLFSVVLPRIRDFRGLPHKSFDGRGNYAIGLKEQTIFPEIQYDKVERVRGMDINIVTTAHTDEEASEFLKLLGCPIRVQ